MPFTKVVARRYRHLADIGMEFCKKQTVDRIAVNRSFVFAKFEHSHLQVVEKGEGSVDSHRGPYDYYP